MASQFEHNEPVQPSLPECTVQHTTSDEATTDTAAHESARQLVRESCHSSSKEDIILACGPDPGTPANDPMSDDFVIIPDFVSDAEWENFLQYSQSGDLLTWLQEYFARIYHAMGSAPEDAAAFPSVSDGNRLKQAKQWREAGEAFAKAAEAHAQKRQDFEAVNCYEAVANCYRKADGRPAIWCLSRAAEIYSDLGQFSAAARLHEAAAEVAEQLTEQAGPESGWQDVGPASLSAEWRDKLCEYQTESLLLEPQPSAVLEWSAEALPEQSGSKIVKVTKIHQRSAEKAIYHYMKAADIWSGEDSPASAAGSRSKAAHLMADIGKLDDAAKEFEQLGISSQQHSLLVSGAKDHMLKSCLCLLCSVPSSCSEKAEDLARRCDSFAGSDELSLVMKLATACAAQDTSAFDSAVTEFERLNNLDDWSRRRLCQVRKSVAEDSPELS